MKKVKHEAKFHTQVMRWISHNLDKFPQSFLIESKVVRPGIKNFPYRELSDKERMLLKQAKDKFILATNSDYDRLGTVCDGYCLSGGGFVFLHWVDKGNKTFYVFDIDELLHDIDAGIKSLSRERAELLCYLKGELK